MKFVDEDGNSPVKALKTAYKVGKKAYKAYRKSETFRLGAALAEEAYSIVDDVNTLSNLEATLLEKGLATFDLATGFGEEAKVGMKMLGVSEREFTKTSRSTLQRRMKELNGNVVPEGKQAHHMLPWKYRKEFEKYKIDINDPQYGTWLETHEHLSKHREYNRQWEEYFKKANVDKISLTAEDIIAEMKQLMHDIYGKDI